MKKLFVILSALGIFLLSTTFASAHATLVRADPAPNARLAAAPTAVTLWFDEELNKRFSAVFVLDKNQTAVDNQQVTFSDDLKQMRVGVKAGLPDGSYNVSYRVLSAVDGHFYPGAFVFTVGTGVAAPVAQAASSTTVDWQRLPLDVLVRGISLLAALAVCGAFTLWLLMGDEDREFALLRRAAGKRMRRWVALSLVILFAGVLGAQVLQAVTASGKSVADVLSQGLAFNSLTETRFGQAALARLLLVGSLLALVWADRGDANAWRIQRLWNVRGMDAVHWALSALILLSLSLSSHAAASSDVLQLALVSDWLHLLAVGAWSGGLFALTVVLRPAMKVVAAEAAGGVRLHEASGALHGRAGDVRPHEASGPLHSRAGDVRPPAGPHAGPHAKVSEQVLRRFSNLAIGSVILFSITGVYAMWRQVSSPGALTDTAYGEALIIKHIFIVPLILLGAVNTVLLRGGSLPGALRFVAGQLRRLNILPGGAGESPLATVLHNVRFEAALAVLVVVAAAGMSALPPARSVAPPAAPAAVAVRTGTDFSSALKIDPFATGNARYELTLSDVQGKPLPDVSSVSLRFNPPDGGAPITVAAAAAGNGAYSVQGDYFTTAGVWRVDALIERTGTATMLPVPFRLSVADPASVPAASFPDINVGMLVALLSVAAGGLLVVYGLRTNQRGGKLAGGSALAMGLALFFGSMAFAAAPARPLAVNPYAPDQTALARGQSIYEQHCTVCHGPTGAGSEFLSADLRPTEFLTNTAAHSDDVLYGLLTNGMPGSGMVPWKTRLTDSQRWQVLNYVEFLVEQAKGSGATAAAAGTK